MKRWAILLCMTLALTGCDALSPEKQAYVVCMAIDYAEDGSVQLMVQIPESGSSSADSGGESQGAAGYALLSVTADTFADALELMGAGVPYPLNFSQLRLCAMSGEFASAADLPALTHELLLIPGMRSTATLAVAVGSAADVLRAQKPDFGMRLSKHIDVTLRTLHSEGVVPDSRLAVCARDFEQKRSDPPLLLCAANPALSQSSGEGGEQPGGGGGSSTGGGGGGGGSSVRGVFGLLDPQNAAGTLPRTGNNPVEFIGAALTSRGRVVGELSGREMQLFVGLSSHAALRVAWSGDSPQLQALLPESMQKELGEYDALLQKLQALQSDALGFGHIAARGFLSERDFAARGFAARYSAADRYVGAEN